MPLQDLGIWEPKVSHRLALIWIPRLVVLQGGSLYKLDVFTLERDSLGGESGLKETFLL